MRKIIYLVFILLILAACGDKTGSDRYVGTEGLVIDFPENIPPDKVYEETAFPVKVEVSNEGAHDVAYEDMIITFSTDPLYIEGGLSPYLPEQHDVGRITTETPDIKGRGQIYREGESRLFSIPTDNAFRAKKVFGQRESPDTEVYTSICYRYNTVLSKEVCVDTNIYETNEREQACEQEDFSFSSGQGAPVAITAIDVEAFPIIDALSGQEVIRPHFDITIRDTGSGRIIGPDELELQSACLLRDIEPEQLNTVRIDAFLFRTELECKPSNLVKIHGGQGEVRCTVPDSSLADPVFSSKQNYITPLIINLSYIYKSSSSREIEIIRIPGNEVEDPFSIGDGEQTGYMYDGDQIMVRDGKKVTECSYYAENPKDAPRLVAGVIDAEFSCACGDQTECLKLAQDKRCFSGGLCPANTYCCRREAWPQEESSDDEEDEESTE